MKKRFSLISISLVLILFSCSGQNVSSDMGTDSSSSVRESSSRKEIISKVKLDSKGGTLSDSEVEVIYHQPYSLPIPEASEDMGNCVFEGWYHRGQKIASTGDSFPFATDVTLTANWENIDFEFSLNSDDTYTVTKRKNARKHVVIPSLYNGLKVTGIAKYAFSRDMTITTLSLPSTIIEVGQYAFYGCANLSSMTFYSSIEEFSASCFEECEKLDDVYCLGTMEEYLTIDFKEYANPCTNGANLYLNNNLLKDVVIPSKINEIKAYAFDGVRSIVDVSLHENVRAIKEYAFHSATNLMTIDFPENLSVLGEYAFDGCYSLKSVMIGSLITEIPVGCFRKCYDLETLSLPDDLSLIDSSAFEDCRSLTNLIIPDKVTEIGQKSFYCCYSLESVTLSSSLERIGQSAFSYDNSIKSITFGKKTTVIPSSAFSSCSSLESINISSENEIYESRGNCLIRKEDKEVVLGCRNSVLDEEILSIGSQAFFGCRKLISIDFPSSLTRIGDYAFSNCAGLTSISIPVGISYIGRNVFTGCDDIISISVDNENPNYASDGNCLLSKDKKKLIHGCKASLIPSEVEEISDEAFYYSSIEEITIPSNVKTIGNMAFSHCYSLKNVTFEDGVTTLGTQCFSHCMDLTDVSLPTTLKELPDGCFRNCQFLEEIVIPEGVELLGVDCFRSNADLRSISLPLTLTEIGEGAFAFDMALSDISVSTENQSFVFENGLLTDKDKEKLYFGYGDVSFPSSLKEILPYALSGNDWITGLVLPEGLERIDENAFCNMRNLRRVSLPKSLTLISDEAFKDDSSLSMVTYSGTKGEFSLIKIGYGIFSSTITETVDCVDGAFRMGEKYYS